MSNRYKRGRAWEYEIIERIESLHRDTLTTRTAGSHGHFDVWAIVPNPLNPDEGSLSLIQAKRGKRITKQMDKEWEEIKGLLLPKKLTVRKEYWIKLPTGIQAWGE